MLTSNTDVGRRRSNLIAGLVTLLRIEDGPTGASQAVAEEVQIRKRTARSDGKAAKRT